jgi:hypothetical protein
MAHSTTQIWLGERGVQKFKDLTSEVLKEIDDLKDPRLNRAILRWIVTLALFYREEVRHPDWYIQQVKCGESQLP